MRFNIHSKRNIHETFVKSSYAFIRLDYEPPNHQVCIVGQCWVLNALSFQLSDCS
jgi:hypothetical protein